MAKIKNCIIHHSVSSFGDVKTFRRRHVKDNGWRDIGYNLVILNGVRKSGQKKIEKEDGLIEMGRGLNLDQYISSRERGAHALGYNRNSVGLCYVGKGKPTRKQYQSLLIVCNLLVRIIPGIKFLAHSDVNKTSCPGWDVKEWAKRNIYRLY